MSTHDFAAALESLAPGVFPRGLRPAQRHVLETFAAEHTGTPDLAIGLPTGEGKTLIGLLLADWGLDQGKSVAYLTGTKQLAEQVQRQAAPMTDLPVHLFYGGHYPGAELLACNEAEAVAVMNYWVYFNSSPKVGPADLLILDDAHLAEQPLSDLFTLRVTRSAGGGSDLYESLCDLLLQAAGAAYPTLKAMRDGSAPRSSPPELIAFHDWTAIAGSAADLIGGSRYLQNNADSRIVWAQTEPHLTRCGVLISPAQIEIRPYHPPTQHVPGYAASQQRIYMSATIGQPGDLQRRLGTKQIITLDTPSDLRSTSTGRRTFAINPGNEPALSDTVLGFALGQAQAAADDGPGRVAWLCASSYEADGLARILGDAGRPVYRLRAGDDPAFERWKATPRADLVTAGRFDGLDMADDVCRLVIVPSVPAGFTEFERFAVAYLSDASYMRHRIGQRLTQALGRANRSDNDSALYLGLDPAFAATLADPAVISSIDTDLSAVIRQALQAHGTGWAPVTSLTGQFWATHRTGTAAPPSTSPRGRARPGRSRGTTDEQAATDSADAEVTAVTRLWLGDHTGAASAAGQAAELLEAAGETEHSAFWRYVQAHAYYERLGVPDITAARQCIERAVAAAPNTAWFVRLRRVAETLAGRTTSPAGHDALFLAWDDWIRESGPALATTIAQYRSWLHGTHDERAEALIILGRLCGVTADRPAGQSATDARWSWADLKKGHRRVWEVKTGTPAAVPRSYINQVLGQIIEERNHHPRANVTGCLLVDLTDTEPDAQRAARDDVAIMHTDAVLAVYDQMADLLRQYLAAWGSGTAAERGTARSAVEPQLPRADWLVRLLKPAGGTVMRAPQAVSILTSARS